MYKIIKDLPNLKKGTVVANDNIAIKEILKDEKLKAEWLETPKTNTEIQAEYKITLENKRDCMEETIKQINLELKDL